MEQESAQLSSQPSTSSPARESRVRHPHSGRAVKACDVCREKKIRCSGEVPCTYCAKRHLGCTFTSVGRREPYSTQIQELHRRLDSHEQRVRSGQEPVDALQLLSDFQPSSRASRNNAATTQTRQASEAFDPRAACPTQPTTADRGNAFVSPATRPSEPLFGPSSCLSSSELFGAEIRTVLAASDYRSHQAPASNGPNTTDPSLLPATRAVQEIPGWPSPEESHELFETVVNNIGISQQLFDIRVLADHLQLYLDDPTTQQDSLSLLEALVIFAIGRLLQARPYDRPNLPGSALYDEAMRLLPPIPKLSRWGLRAVGALGLAAFYLQLTDRKEEAYTYSSIALRLAITRNMHRKSSSSKLQPSAAIHQNRLWWSIYMQERRLAAAGGYPMAIADDAITSDEPWDYPGFPSAAALRTNIRIARVTGQIRSVIYGQESDSEASFLLKVENMLHSLHDIERSMPAEYGIDFQPPLRIGKQRFYDASQAVARTSASLYLMLFQAIIHAIRPVVLNMVRNKRENGWDIGSASPALRRLAEICVESASKTILITLELRMKGIQAKHAFLDLDALFSSAFIFVLALAISPGDVRCTTGLQGCRSIICHLKDSGNNTAATRLSEIDQMCAHLRLVLDPGFGNFDDATAGEELSTSLRGLCEPFSFLQTAVVATALHQTEDGESSFRADSQPGPRIHAGPGEAARPDGFTGSTSPQQMFEYYDLSNISLNGEDGLYGMYKDADYSFADADNLDWIGLDPWMS